MNFGNNFIPFDELIFFRGGGEKPPTRDGLPSWFTVIEDSPITELPTASADRSDWCRRQKYVFLSESLPPFKTPPNETMVDVGHLILEGWLETRVCQKRGGQYI